jgi:acyl-CoA reductase-like NAD-dependent aldehyde dehydrogenase
MSDEQKPAPDVAALVREATDLGKSLAEHDSFPRTQDVLRKCAAALTAQAEMIAELERQNGEHIQNAAAAISNSADALAKSLQAERQRDAAVKVLREIAKPRGVIWEPGKSTADGWRKHFSDIQFTAKIALAAIAAPAPPQEASRD